MRATLLGISARNLFRITCIIWTVNMCILNRLTNVWLADCEFGAHKGQYAVQQEFDCFGAELYVLSTEFSRSSL